MWIETADDIRQMFISSVAIIFEHSINGLVLPALYLLTHDEIYYNLALYGEISFMIYANALIAVSYMLGKDVTIEQMHRSVWPLLLVHHISSLTLCIGCIVIEENVPKDLVCMVLLALVGLTSSLHYVGQILDFSPLAQSNTPYVSLALLLCCHDLLPDISRGMQLTSFFHRLDCGITFFAWHLRYCSGSSTGLRFSTLLWNTPWSTMV